MESGAGTKCQGLLMVILKLIVKVSVGKELSRLSYLQNHATFATLPASDCVSHQYKIYCAWTYLQTRSPSHHRTS